MNNEAIIKKTFIPINGMMSSKTGIKMRKPITMMKKNEKNVRISYPPL